MTEHENAHHKNKPADEKQKNENRKKINKYDKIYCTIQTKGKYT